MSEPRTTSLVTPRGLVTVTCEPERPRRALRREPEHLQFLGDHWAGLSAAAYVGFCEHGAGCVVLWRETAPRRWRQKPFEPQRLWYATQAHVLPGATDAHFDGWEAEQIETYDPERQAIVVFSEGSQISGYLVQGTLAPPEARRSAAARLN